MTELNNSLSCFIKQIVEWGEIITGCEFANKYMVYTRNNIGQTTLLFACQEVSGCCERNYLRSFARPFEMGINAVNGPQMFSNFNSNNFAVLDKNYSISCLCCCRPEVKINYQSLNGPYSGKVVKPFTLYDPVFRVYNKENQVRFSITSDCYQCGLMCSDSCGCFSPVIFYIFNGEYCDSDKAEQSVGRIIKQAMGFQSMVSDADNFQILFPIDASPEDKFNLISAALLIDYCLFELTGRRR